MEKFPKYERVHPRAIDEIVKDINQGMTPPPSLNHRLTFMKKQKVLN